MACMHVWYVLLYVLLIHSNNCQWQPAPCIVLDRKIVSEDRTLDVGGSPGDSQSPGEP
jgi:hypothetical protein